MRFPRIQHLLFCASQRDDHLRQYLESARQTHEFHAKGLQGMATSSIEWTESTWNPVTGCTKISPGCANCYAERMSVRLHAMGQPNYANGFKLTTHEHMLDHPLHWRKPRRIFVNSMSDLFHHDVPDDFIVSVFEIMRRAHWHHFQVLTKRSDRLVELNRIIDWPENVWMGVSVENQKYCSRIKHLSSTDAAVKFLSIEPLIGDVSAIDVSGMDWVIVGGESGPGARPMKPEWVRQCQRSCEASDVAFFFKQAGTVLAREWNCTDTKGTIMPEWPEEFRVREYPRSLAVL